MDPLTDCATGNPYEFNVSLNADSKYGGNFTVEVTATDGSSTGIGNNNFIYINGTMMVIDAVEKPPVLVPVMV